MSARKFSAVVGIVLLICVVVGIFVVIFGTENNPGSSSQRMEESLTIVRDWETKVRPTETTKRQRVHEPPTQHHKEKHKVANEMERILWRDPLGSREEKTTTTSSPFPSSLSSSTTEKPRQVNERYGVAVERPKILHIAESSFVHQQQQQQQHQEPGAKESLDKKKEISSQMSWNEFSPSPPPSNPTWTTTTRPHHHHQQQQQQPQPSVNLRTHLNRRILSPGESLRASPPPPPSRSQSTYSGAGVDNDLDIKRRQPSHLYHHHHSSPHRPPPHHQSIGSSFERGPDPGSQEQVSEEADQYVLHGTGVGGGSSNGEEEEEEEEEDGQLLQGIDVRQLFDLASNLYTSGTNASDLQGFLRVINETVNRGNNSGLLTRLNELYTRPSDDDPMMLLSQGTNSNALVGRNAYETSLTAFVFMSFGVFLLNQIHNFIGKESGSNNLDSSSRGGRHFHDVNSLLHDQGESESNLDILFKSPQLSQNWTTGEDQKQMSHSGGSNNNKSHTNGSGDGSSSTTRTKDSSTNPGYVNDMFRALLNLVNAYTKDSQVLECIWSLYCQDLDKTAGKQGLYGIAARINSIGLRLIMDQIPAELTLDMMLRSLIGYDALPCSKMFPKKCQLDKASAALTPVSKSKK